MIDTTRYPKLNDSDHKKPMLSAFGTNVLGELVWLAIPTVLFVIVYFLR
jgi:hypothetical protein